MNKIILNTGTTNEVSETHEMYMEKDITSFRKLPFVPCKISMTRIRCSGDVRTRWESMETTSQITDRGLFSERQEHRNPVHCK